MIYIIDKTKIRYGPEPEMRITRSHLKDILSRVRTKEGEVLHGEKALRYMKENEKLYEGRLKGYYEEERGIR